MGTMQIKLPDRLRRRLAARASENGFDRVEAYIEAVLRADVGDDDLIDDAELERVLVRRLNGGGTIDCTPEFVAEFKREVARRRASRNKK
jgi:hypothetical protein